MKKSTSTNVTIRDIAKASGCSHTTVSRVLRGERYVKDELRQKVEATAEEMGYKVNPLLATFMSARRKHVTYRAQDVNIGWINTHPNKDFWNAYPINRSIIQAAKDSVTELGFGFDEIWAQEPNLTGERLEKILNARAIHGILLSNDCEIIEDINFDHSKYAIAGIGPPRLGHHLWHRATVSYRQNIETAFENLYQKGYRRIAMSLPIRRSTQDLIDKFNQGKATEIYRHLDEQTRAEIGSYLVCSQSLNDAERIRPFLYDRNDNENYLARLAKWLSENKPDALISGDHRAMDAAKLASISVPAEMAIALTYLSSPEDEWAGLDIRLEHQAAAAVELLSGAILKNQRGIPDIPRCIYLRSRWKDGWTAPQKS